VTETKTFPRRVAKASGVAFTLHDLRRTFITIAESLGTPPYALKRLLNHRVGDDVTGGYIVIDVERLRNGADCHADTPAGPTRWIRCLRERQRLSAGLADIRNRGVG
jgi:hypothetical protein